MKLMMTRDALKFLVDLKTSAKQYVQVTQKVFALMSDANPNDAAAMQGYSVDYLRVDVGEYRIIYRVGDDTVMIVLIGKRNGDEVYKKLERK